MHELRTILSSETPTPIDVALPLSRIVEASSTHHLGRLSIAAHFVYAGRVGGAEQMLYNLLRGLWQSGVDVTVLCGTLSNFDPAFAEEVRAAARVREDSRRTSRFIAEQLACLTRELSSDAILFPNYFVPPVVPKRAGRIVTVLHDLQSHHFPQYFSARKRAWLLAAHHYSVRKADRMVVISEFVRQDAVRLLGQKFEEKLTVIPNPVDWNRFGSPGLCRPMLEWPYILSVAAHYPHKNLEVLLRAFAEVARHRTDLHLVFCGQSYSGLRGVSGSRTGLLALARELDIESRVRVTGYIDDAELGAWYRGATMFAFPSLFEGFGMPPVEALGFGLPTVTSRLTSLPEVTLGMATYVDNPCNIAEWASKMAEIAATPAQYAPAAQDSARLRRHYDARRIADAYSNVCFQ